MVRLYLFGMPRLEVDGRQVEFDTRKAMALLAHLALAGRAQSRDALAALLWPDSNQTSARAALRRTLSTLRRGLPARSLLVEREMVELPAQQIWVDVHAFRQSLEACSQHGHSLSEICQACLEPLARAANLYTDHFMAGFGLRDSTSFDDWQFFENETLRRELASALERLSTLLAAQGDHAEAISHARRWLVLDLLREEAHRQLMRLYAWSDQRNAALRQYRECVRILEQELGVPPLDETTHLYQQVLENRVEPMQLFHAHQPAHLAPGVASPQPEPRLALKSIEPPASLSLELPMIGRADEWRTLVLCHSAARSDGWLVVLEGEGGIGKTRLAEDFLTFARSQGARIFQARCYEGEANLAFGPFTEGLAGLLQAQGTSERLAKIPAHWLAEAARLQPELHSLVPALPQPPLMEGPGALSRFNEGLRRVLQELLSGPVAGILLVDDLHWADPASLDLLAYILRRLEGSGIFVILTWRGESAENKPQIQQLLTDAQRRKRFTRLRLERLSAAGIDELVRAAVLSPLEDLDQLSLRLYRESEGLPLFAISYLNSLRQSSALEPGRGSELPGEVPNLWQARVASLDEIQHQLLGTAASIGRSFDYSILKEASGRSDIETITGLETLLAQGLIVESSLPPTLGEVMYDFIHEKLRELIYKEISLARRQLLHRRIAEALTGSARGRREAGTLAAQVAYHLQQAGLHSQAAEYFKQAGEQARALFANTSALSHFQAALANGYTDPAGLHELIGDLHTLSGDYRAAVQSYETATALCLPSNLARLEHKLGEVHSRKGEWPLAECYFQVALKDAEGSSATALRALILADWSLVAHRLGNTTQALELAHQSLALAQEIKDIYALSQVHNTLGMLARSRGDSAEAFKWLNSSLQNARELGDPARQAAALNNLALVHRDGQHLDQALEFTQAALDLCSEQGDRHREAALLNNYADLLHAAGRTAESMDYLRKAVVIFAEIGVQVGEQEPEIWKLTEW